MAIPANIKRVKFEDDAWSQVGSQGDFKPRKYVVSENRPGIDLSKIPDLIKARSNELYTIANQVKPRNVNIEAAELRAFISQCDEGIRIYNQLRNLAPNPLHEEVQALQEIEAARDHALVQFNQIFRTDARIEALTIDIFQRASNSIILERGHGNILNPEARIELENIYLPLLRSDIWRQSIAKVTDDDLAIIRERIKAYLNNCIISRRILCCAATHHIDLGRGRIMDDQVPGLLSTAQQNA